MPNNKKPVYYTYTGFYVNKLNKHLIHDQRMVFIIPARDERLYFGLYGNKTADLHFSGTIASGADCNGGFIGSLVVGVNLPASFAFLTDNNPGVNVAVLLFDRSIGV